MLELYKNALPTQQIYLQWEELAKKNNFGAFCIFCGIVRDENQINGLSFDIYEPLLKEWFSQWEKIAQQQNMIVCMAHSVGDVLLGESSYMSAILSSNRKNALELYAEFVEDFKRNAPIWKYDLIGQKRIYAQNRSYALRGSGILADKS
ncbi:molybdopterin synthase catalytic subunit [Helicobacter kayseriensis]|uniref:molybdopterin synthase catalytic subunit n=1 Tax=Helicobacter kayseriensis TaxID=2905877 RepID=UPI001E4FD693|nr:molybdenum cofactor biosynthesis protein MoaE [Helicobacter kayseriensis]MCE3046792.1 molybdenum cofactor biosynthesis protein MoaE [Helicobacter kayseriensis]MCE3047906.1 molybdenum cofactor biosynthesis protein MoaE [Helicobacter kayseriensis]